jgi:hypothetical protein
MKQIFISLCAAVAIVFSLAACSPELVNGLDENGIPSTDVLEVTVTVDQTTNMVSFSARSNDPSVTPVWVMAEGEYVTALSFERRYRTAGTYSVEVKAYNRDGFSDASLVKEFTVNQDYVVPVSPLFGTGTKEWKVAAGVQGHMGLGGANSWEWWTAAPNEKVGTGLYDDRVTFKSDGTYIYNPGPDGLTFVNAAVSGGAEDGDIPGAEEVSTYVFDEDAMTITLPEGVNLPYISHPSQVASACTYTILELNDNQLTLQWWVADQSMFWQLILEPSSKVEKSPLYGNGSKIWKMASMLQGHLGCGESVTNPAGWWSAAPDEKAGSGLYDDRVTFSEDGKYIYDPGPDGLMFVNASITGTGADGDIAGTLTESTYEFNEDDMTITLPSGVSLPYVADPAQTASACSYIVTKLESDQLVVVLQLTGICWQFILVPEDYVVEGGGGDEEEIPAFDPGAQLEVSQYAEGLVGSWTWESSSAGHFGCGESIANPTGWWSAGPEAQAGASMYDDVMTFAADGTYAFDPVDGMTYRNVGVTNYPGKVVDMVGSDYRVEAMKMASTYAYTAEGDFPSFTLPAGVLFSYIASDDQFMNYTTYYITGMWENQVEISWYSPGISWRYRLKRVVEAAE